MNTGASGCRPTNVMETPRVPILVSHGPPVGDNDAMTPEILILAIVVVVSVPLGAWAAIAKGRSPFEGAVFGLILGPLGVLVVALLPVVNLKPASGGRGLSVDDEGLVASIADRLRVALDDADPAWSALPYQRQRAILRPVERAIVRDLGLSPTRAGDLLAPARRAALQPGG